MDRAQAQPAPIPRAVVPADAAPEAMTALFGDLEPGENSVSIAGAVWLQLKFTDFNLGTDGTLTISSEAGESQTFTQDQLEDWEGLTAIFNDSELTVTLNPGEGAPGESDEISASIEEIIIGLPGADVEGAVADAPQTLRNLLGDELERYIPADLPRQPERSGVEAICGTSDNRVASGHPLVGRIMPIGCTGWIIQGGALLTAGHCISASTQTVEFNVPASQPNGTTVSAAVRDQYRVVGSSIVDAFTGVGNDWALFRVLPNTETGLMPIAAQGGAFQLSNTANPNDVRITGYGVDGPAPNFGNPPPRNGDNQTQQTHPGALTDHQVGGPNSATLLYTVDTQGGNSGSPVLVEGGGNVAVGIHTNGGCSASGGANAGTSFRNQGLWAAVGAGGRADDLVWQHRSGQVHYWAMQGGQRQSGINVHVPVSGDWKLAGAGDVDGDGTDDIVWQHRSGQVHYWPMQKGQRQGGINVHDPVGGDWKLAGVGDVDGDGTDDLVWQHRLGQVHYWPMQNGQRQGGINVHIPVGGEWKLAGAGDVNGDRTDDLVWQHRLGQVHYWPMQNGQRQGGINVHDPVGGDWTLASVGDVDGDHTDDIVWQHRSGQVHYWPMQNGQRQGGINVHVPVDGDWTLAGVGDID
jgi:hypothetical protein